MDLLAFDGVPGACYLLIYLAVCLGFMIAARYLSDWLREPGGDGAGLSLGREQVAYLAEGPRQVVASAFAVLLEAGNISLERNTTWKPWPCARVELSLSKGATPLERAIFYRGTGVPLEPSFIEQLCALPEIDAVRESLEDQRLILSSRAARAVRVWAALVIGLAVPFAIPRLMLAFERNRRVGLLVAMMVAVTGFVLLVTFSRIAVTRSRRGDAVLARYVRLGRSVGAGLSLGDQVSLQGPGAYPELTEIFSTSGSDGGGSDGGGCGGGGCGGCGGCGG